VPPPLFPSGENYDLIARPYRWLEYITLGRSLERCRFSLLPRLTHVTSALVVGDGDGRFITRFLFENPAATADVIDMSKAMLALSRKRVLSAAAESRARFHQADVRQGLPVPCGISSGQKYDLVVTHFMLDCLTGPQVRDLVQNILPSLVPGAVWVVSDFAVPPKGLVNFGAKMLIRGLYFAFRCLTGLRVRSLPDHAPILRHAGFENEVTHQYLGGILRSELWRIH
jgi:SAM-dependent methyltransferase